MVGLLTNAGIYPLAAAAAPDVAHVSTPAVIAGNSNSSYSDTRTLGASVTGRKVIAGVATVAGADRAPYTFSINGVTPTGTAATSTSGNGNNHCQQVYWDDGDLPAGGSYTYLISGSGNFTCHLGFVEYSGVAAGAPEETGTAADADIDTTVALTSVSAGALIVDVVSNDNDATFTWSSSQNERHSSNGQPTTHSLGIGDIIGASSGANNQRVIGSVGAAQRQATASYAKVT